LSSDTYVTFSLSPKLLHFSKAAAQLGMAQPPLSQQMQSLTVRI
jgi:DNA-binding transcriptional LysR family regulator